jgi:hypothetical protein
MQTGMVAYATLSSASPQTVQRRALNLNGRGQVAYPSRDVARKQQPALFDIL